MNNSNEADWVAFVDIVETELKPAVISAHLSPNDNRRIAAGHEQGTSLRVQLTIDDLGVWIDHTDPEHGERLMHRTHPVKNCTKLSAADIAAYHDATQPDENGIRLLLADLRHDRAGLYHVAAFITHGNPEALRGIIEKLGNPLR
jgi:hypothetical protein